MNDNLEYFSKIDEAINYFENSTDEDLLSLLDNENEALKQVALLNLKFISSEEQAEKITNTLTDHSSETREYSSFLINRLMKYEKFREFFFGDFILNKFVKAISDVNPKVCRKIIEILPLYKDKDKMRPELLKNIFLLIDDLEEKNKNKNYTYNTASFHLYWNIFALGYIMDEQFFYLYEQDFLRLIKILFNFNEYTIREKAAYLLNKIKLIASTPEIDVLILKYSNDENFFVKEIFS